MIVFNVFIETADQERKRIAIYRKIIFPSIYLAKIW